MCPSEARTARPDAGERTGTVDPDAGERVCLMTMEEFIEQHRGELDRRIREVVGPNFDLDDDERRLWILNAEELYLWAEEEGVEL